MGTECDTRHLLLCATHPAGDSRVPVYLLPKMAVTTLDTVQYIRSAGYNTHHITFKSRLYSCARLRAFVPVPPSQIRMREFLFVGFAVVIASFCPQFF